MKITLELSSGKLISSAGFCMPLTELRHKYGEGSGIEIEVLRDGVPVVATELEEFVWCVKKRHKFAAAEIVAGCDDFTWDSDLNLWLGEVNYNQTYLTNILIADQGAQDETDYVHLWAELAYRKDSSSGWQRTQLIKDYYLDNALWKGTETIPGGGSVEPTTGPWLTPLINVLPADVVNNTTSFVDISGLYFPVEANHTYHFRFVLNYHSSATNNGARFSIDGPASPTSLTFRTEATTSASGRSLKEGNTAYDTPAGNSGDSLTTGNIGIIEGFIKPSASGVVTGRVASEVATALASITVKAGSMVQYARLD